MDGCVAERRSRIVCVGGANVDRKARAFETIRFRESNPVSVSRTGGGVAGNIAANLTQLGVHTTLLTVVGDDPEGVWLVEEMRRRGIDTESIVRLPGERTGSYTAVLDHTGEMALALADMHIFDRFGVEMLERRWDLLAASDAVVMDTNVSAELLSYAIERCGTERIPLCINPVSAIKAKKLPKRLSGVEMLAANRAEAEALTGVEIAAVDDAYRAAERLLAAGVGRAVVTMGAEGVVWADRSGSGRLRSPVVPVVDVTGAGDALMSGVIYGIARRAALEEACRWGVNAAALTVQSERTVTSISAEQIGANAI